MSSLAMSLIDITVVLINKVLNRSYKFWYSDGTMTRTKGFTFGYCYRIPVGGFWLFDEL